MVTKYYLKRDVKGKIRIAILLLDKVDGYYTLCSQTGLLDGARVVSPTVYIKAGKAKRTIDEQAELQFNHEESLYLNKGYKNIADLGLTPSDLVKLDLVESAVNKENTDANGSVKPMLAKSYEDVKKKEVFNRKMYASRKLDGVRCSLFVDPKTGKLATSSRGGKDYNVAAEHITNDPIIISMFESFPGMRIDGELYIHGRPLSYISGLCRKKAHETRHDELKFHCYDIYTNEPFEKRLEVLMFIKQLVYESNNIVIVDHIPVKGLDNILKLHDKFVEEGYEGVVCRDANKPYLSGARDDRMIKFKMFQDDEFLITGISEGLRPEDMCFTLKTKEGYDFMAKPMGDSKLKDWYRKHIDELIGKMGTVKYFHYTTTDTPVPNLPVFKCVRDIKDMDI